MKLTVKDIALFGMLGALMFASDLMMEALPNIHLIGAFIVAVTTVYRTKALFPIYIYVLLNGIYSGFSLWWVPYLYVWTVLWMFVMLLPKKMPVKIAPIVYMCVSAAHGFLFGIIYSPSQLLLLGLDFQGMLSWIAAGIPFDIVHGISNFICGLLIVPIIKVLKIAKR